MCLETSELPASGLEGRAKLVEAETLFEAVLDIQDWQNFSADRRHHMACTLLTNEHRREGRETMGEFDIGEGFHQGI